MRIAELLKGIVVNFCIMGVTTAMFATVAISKTDCTVASIFLYATSLTLLGSAYLLGQVSTAYRRVYASACKFKRERDKLAQGMEL